MEHNYFPDVLVMMTTTNLLMCLDQTEFATCKTW